MIMKKSGIYLLLLALATSLVLTDTAFAAKGGKKGGGSSGGDSGGGGTTASSVFTAVGNMQAIRRYHTATKLNDGRVLFAGGVSHYDSTTGTAPINNSAEVYDPATKNFTPVASMNIPRTNHTATLLADGKILVTGGLSSSDYFGNATEASAEIYDPASNTWTLLANVMTQPRSQHKATLLPNGNVLLTTEAAPPPYSWYGFGNNTAELYEAATQSFIELPSMKAIRVLHASSVLPNGNVIMMGGQQDGIWNSSSEVYDANARSFTTSATMNYIHTGISGVTLNAAGDVLVTGQVSPFDNGHSAERYNAATASFTQAANMIQTRQNHTSAISSNGNKVLLVGGRYEEVVNGFSSIITAVNAEIYDVATNTFTDIGPLNTVRGNGHTTTALNDGSFLVAGGSDPSTSAEIYQP